MKKNKGDASIFEGILKEKGKIEASPSFIILFFIILLAAKLSWPSILRLYVESGIGDCKKIPLLCMEPAQQIINPDIDKECILESLPYNFPKLSICIPKGFTVIQETIKKVYYKKREHERKDPVIYLLYEEPVFFPNLYPQLKKIGVNDNYEFIKRIMYANEKNIKNLNDVFFVVMKGIFTPDIGDQKSAVMASFSTGGFKGFINYNLSKPNQYFDCNIINSEGGYFKVYIKDIGASLDLSKVLGMITTIKETGHDS